MSVQKYLLNKHLLSSALYMLINMSIKYFFHPWKHCWYSFCGCYGNCAKLHAYELRSGLISSCQCLVYIISEYYPRGLFLIKSTCLGLQGSQRLEPQREEDSRKWEGSADRKQDVGPTRVTHTLQSSENVSVKLIISSACEMNP